ncbi:MAG: hypothetical protein J7539_09470 [Niabella sp.]|nr:hypothetical protein [Niabella sp.]
MKEFCLKKVSTLNFGIVLAIAFSVAGFYFLLYFLLIGYFKLSFLIGLFFLIFISVYGIMQYYASDLTLKFNKDDLCIIKKGVEKKYAKADILGFYSQDYEHMGANERAVVSILIKLNNGKTLSLSDIELNAKFYNQEKLINLKQLLKTAQTELGFRKVKKSVLRSLLKLGPYWYSK